MATNNSDNYLTPVTIANGGTNASSFSTTNGIVTYDGTRLVTSSSAKIDSSNRMTNTSQPCFLVTSAADQTDVTGDGTAYTMIYADEIFDQGSDFDGTSTFTAPRTGLYKFYVGYYFEDITTGMTDCSIYLTTTGATYYTMRMSFASMLVSGGVYSTCAVILAPMTATDTATVTIDFAGATKVVDVIGSTAAGVRTPYFSGHLVC
jgi:hypothetical protein